MRPLSPKTVSQAASTAAGSASTTAPGKSRLGPDLQAQIGHQLRAMYHDVLNEKVPDRFVQLLKELAEKEKDGA